MPPNIIGAGFHSASRVGHSDLGKNRSRIEEIRAEFSRDKEFPYLSISFSLP